MIKIAYKSFNNVGERSTAKNYCLISLPYVVSKVFEKLVNKRIVDHQEKCDIFSNFQYGFRSSRSTADLLTVVSDRFAQAFRTGAIWTVGLDIFKVFNRVCHAGLVLKLLGQNFLAIFLLFSVIDSFRWFWMGSLHKNI